MLVIDRGGAIARVEEALNRDTPDPRLVVTKMVETTHVWVCLYGRADGQALYHGLTPLCVVLSKVSGACVDQAGAFRAAWTELSPTGCLGLVDQVRRWFGRRRWGQPISGILVVRGESSVAEGKASVCTVPERGNETPFE